MAAFSSFFQGKDDLFSFLIFFAGPFRCQLIRNPLTPTNRNEFKPLADRCVDYCLYDFAIVALKLVSFKNSH